MNKNLLNLIYLGHLLLAGKFTPSLTNGNHVGIQSSAAVHLCSHLYVHVFVSFTLPPLPFVCTTMRVPQSEHPALLGKCNGTSAHSILYERTAVEEMNGRRKETKRKHRCATSSTPPPCAHARRGGKVGTCAVGERTVAEGRTQPRA